MIYHIHLPMSYTIPKSVKKMLGDQIFCWAPRFFNLVVRVGDQILKRVYTPGSAARDSFEWLF